MLQIFLSILALITSCTESCTEINPQIDSGIIDTDIDSDYDASIKDTETIIGSDTNIDSETLVDSETYDTETIDSETEEIGTDLVNYFTGLIYPSDDSEIYPSDDRSLLFDAAVYDAEIYLFNTYSMGLIKFKLPEQCKNATISEASLSLSFRRIQCFPNPTKIGINSIDENWNEDTLEYNMRPTVAEQIATSQLYNWQTFNPEDKNAIQTINFNVLEEIQCISNNICENNGFLIRAANPETYAYEVDGVMLTSEYPVKEYRPALYLNCTDGNFGETIYEEPIVPIIYNPPATETLMNNELIWYRNISNRDDIIHPNNDLIMDWIAEAPTERGFLPGGVMMIDSSLKLMHNIDSLTELRDIYIDDEHMNWGSDTGPVPLIPGGAVEAYHDYNCSVRAGHDCHLLLLDETRDYLFEFWTFDIPNGQYDGPDPTADFFSAWDLNKDYGWNYVTGIEESHSLGRGRDCTSSDAAGFPITTLMPTVEEIVTGNINHAIRFIMPDSSIMFRRYVAPATHATYSAGPKHSLPYGSQLRLKSDSYLLNKYSSIGLTIDENGKLSGTIDGYKFDYHVYNLPVTEGANNLIDAMQTYGMFLSDGGSYALTVESQEFTDYKYCENPVPGCIDCCYEDPNRILGAFDLTFLDISDFEIIDNGPTYFVGREDCQLLDNINWQLRE